MMKLRLFTPGPTMVSSMWLNLLVEIERMTQRGL